MWEITHKCNFGCVYCFQARKRLENRIRILHPSDFRTIIARMTDLSVKDVLITGGEIYWIKDSLPEICDRLSEEGMTYSVSTSFIHDDDFFNFLVELHPRALNISLDPRGTERKEKHERLISQVLKVLRRCQQEGIPVKATGVLTPISLANLDEYIIGLTKLASQFGSLSSIYVTYPYDIGYVKTHVRPEEGLLRKASRRLKIPPVLRKRIRFINFHRFNGPLQSCPAGDKIVHVEPNGDVYPCHLFANLPKETFFLGNLLSDSAREINSRLLDFATRTKEAIEEYKEIDQCRKCRVKQKCGGGCVAEIVSVGQLIEPKLICKKIKPPPKRVLFEPVSLPLPLTLTDSSDLTNEEKQQISEYISQNLRKGHDLAHGLDHINCVVEYARHIAKEEGGNLRIVTAAAYFHDFEPRRKLIYEQHTEYSAQQAASFLKGLGLTKPEISQVYECIICSSYGAHEIGRKPISLAGC